MYVIHDSLVGEETITFAYIRARVVIRMCFPTSFIEYLWISFPLSLLLHMSPAWPGVLLYLIQTLEGYMFMARSCCFANTKWLGFLSDCFLSLTHAPMHMQPQPQPCEKTDGGRKQLNSIAVGSRAHQGTRQQLMTPRTLAGKQGDF